ncbi:hypothetical protein [Candidatus Albibeggiatoa sp. nov. NOAA]|uniref:GHMP family kinase ATP-binding protein n=1 Tax=Candidatus Albibeggiatoa sp. nov. NOAA TaxID=3162724 RepID=UPI0032F38B01|nr:hypothetical protein [Thiotrichaceae bacterium]
MIISRTPFRISFFGGGSDYPAWYLKHGGQVLSTSIDKYCFISCRHLPPFFEHTHRIVYSKIESVVNIDDIQHPAVRGVLQWSDYTRGLEIHHDGDLPARSGLGSSSSFTVGLINALHAIQGRYISKEGLAQAALHVEQNVIGENVGSQDQIAAAFGGFNLIRFLQNGSFQVEPIVLPSQRLAELQQHLILVFTGFSRIASEIAKDKISNLEHKVTEVTHLSNMVSEAMNILSQPSTNINEFGQLLHEAWQYKRGLSTKVTTSAIDDIYNKAIQSGALGGKLLGAGGGGFMLLFAPPEQHQTIIQALDLVHVPFEFDNSGSKIVLYEPNGL